LRWIERLAGDAGIDDGRSAIRVVGWRHARLLARSSSQ
jgi:hypothetical protein